MFNLELDTSFIYIKKEAKKIGFWFDGQYARST